MTEGLQEEIINLNKGIVRTPSVGEAGELSECVNLISKNNELVNIPIPNDMDIDLNGGTLMYVHKVKNYDNYIYFDGDEAYSVSINNIHQLIHTFANNDANEHKVIACGNVLVFYGEGKKTIYLLFNGSNYIQISGLEQLPSVQIGMSGNWETMAKNVSIKGPIIYPAGTIYRGADEIKLVASETISATFGPEFKAYQTLAFPADRAGHFRFKISDSTYPENTVFSLYLVNYTQDNSQELSTVTNGEYFDFEGRSSGSDVYYLRIVLTNVLAAEGQTGNANLSIYELKKDDSTWSGNTVYGAYTGDDMYVRGISDFVGLYNSFLKTQTDNNKFVSDLFVRYAFRLVTGDIVSASAPMHVVINSNGAPRIFGKSPFSENATDASSTEANLLAVGYAADMYYKITSGQYSLISQNIVQSLVIGVSLPIFSNDISQEPYRIQYVPSASRSLYCNAYSGQNSYAVDNNHPSEYLIPEYFTGYKDRVVDYSTFRIIKEIPIAEITADSWNKVEIDSGVLSGLSGTSDSDMMIPDSTSNILSYTASKAFSYNNRLTLADVYQKYNNGYPLSQMNPVVTGSHGSAGYKAYVTIDGAQREMTKKTETLSAPLGKWFYFPNVNATRVEIYTDAHGYGKIVLPLKKHPFLNGSYFFGDIMALMNQNNWLFLEDNYYISHEENKYITSALNQPLVPDDIVGYIGNGEIIAVSNTSKALSQGQFGQFPLMFFCTDGIWAVSIGSDGSYQTTSPVSRDVLLSSNGIAQTDNAIVFTTAQGLKMLQGSETALLSSPIHGLNIDESRFLEIDGYTADTVDFLQQIKTSYILYDYIGQLLHLFVANLGSTANNIHYVYSLESGQWSKQWLPGYGALKTIVPGYPYSTLQFGNYLYQYTYPESTDTRDGFFLTRPMTLGNPLVRKALWDLRMIGQKTSTSTTRSVMVFYSQDNTHWYKLKSLKANSAKYFRLLVRTTFTDLDTLSGIVMQYVERWKNRLR